MRAETGSAWERRHWEAWPRDAEGSSWRGKCFRDGWWQLGTEAWAIRLATAPASSGKLVLARPPLFTQPHSVLRASTGLGAERHLPSSPRAVSVATMLNNHTGPSSEL